MVEVEEIELDLELSIGGTIRKPAEKPKPEFGPGGVVSDPDPRDGGTGMQWVDPHQQGKRDIQALRRMEAKRKREQKRGTGGDRVGDSEPECQRVFKREKDFLDGVSRFSTVPWTTPFQQPQQYATVQYVPLNNGGLPLPCWFPNENNVGGIDSGDGKARSNGASRGSSSAVSDYQCSSREDGGSTDSHNHSANSANLSHLTDSKENSIRIQPEQCASSHPMRSKHGNNLQDNRKHNNVKETQAQPNIMQQLTPLKLKVEAAATNNKALPLPIVNKPLPNENSSSVPLKETKVDMGKSSKPLTRISFLSQMPYVSTKGNGPNGKTVNGFLHRYSKSEVSIICVCHGSTFSPAEFVQHAGGTDISHPLRHITVIPSAFG